MTPVATGRRDAGSAMAARRARRASPTTQADAIETASHWCADAIAADGLVHLFGTGHSRIPVEEMFPRYGSYPGFNPIVELSMTFHTQVVGANGQRQAMFIERTPGLAEVILSNFRFGPDDVMMVFSASGLTAVPVEMARGAKARGMRVIAVTSVAQSMSAEPEPAAGERLLEVADLVIDVCSPPRGRPRDHRRARHPGRPRSTVGAIAIVNAIKVRTAELLVERGAMPPVITPRERRGHRAVEDPVRRSLSRACAAARPCDRPARRWVTKRAPARH